MSRASRDTLPLGELRQLGLGVDARCLDCGHHTALSLPSLIERLGPQKDMAWWEPKLRCTHCGSTNGRVWIVQRRRRL